MQIPKIPAPHLTVLNNVPSARWREGWNPEERGVPPNRKMCSSKALTVIPVYIFPFHSTACTTLSAPPLPSLGVNRIASSLTQEAGQEWCAWWRVEQEPDFFTGLCHLRWRKHTEPSSINMITHLYEVITQQKPLHSDFNTCKSLTNLWSK